jgi:hypothetical protein
MSYEGGRTLSGLLGIFFHHLLEKQKSFNFFTAQKVLIFYMLQENHKVKCA